MKKESKKLQEEISLYDITKLSKEITPEQLYEQYTKPYFIPQNESKDKLN